MDNDTLTRALPVAPCSTLETSLRHGGIGSSWLRPSVRTQGLPRQVSSAVHRRTRAAHPAARPRSACATAPPHLRLVHAAGLPLELELGLLGGPRLRSLPSHAGQTLPHYAAAAAAPAGRSATRFEPGTSTRSRRRSRRRNRALTPTRSATMRGGGLTYPTSVAAAAPPRQAGAAKGSAAAAKGSAAAARGSAAAARGTVARRSPRLGWAVSAQGWPRGAPEQVEPGYG